MAAAVLLAACSNDEVIDSSTLPAIGFNVSADHTTMSRATDSDDYSSTKLPQAISVYAKTWKPGSGTMNNVFGNQIVNNNSGNWEYNPLQYWTAGNNYRFSGFAPAVSGAVSTVGWSFTPNDVYTANIDELYGAGVVTYDNASVKGQQDFLYDFKTVANAVSNQTPVAFQFKHMLSRVRFQFENQIAAGTIFFKIENVKITNAIGGATLDVTLQDPTWQPTAGSLFTADFATAADQQQIGYNGKITTEHCYLIPNEAAQSDAVYNVSFDIVTYSFSSIDNAYIAGNTYHKTATIKQAPMQKGYSYSYMAGITTENIADEEVNPIQFTVQVDKWQDWGGSTDLGTIDPTKD